DARPRRQRRRQRHGVFPQARAGVRRPFETCIQKRCCCTQGSGTIALSRRPHRTHAFMTWIALATYRTNAKGEAPAVVVDDKLYDAREVLPGGVGGAIADWPRAQGAVRQLADQVRAGKLPVLREGMAALTAPFRPSRIFCAAANYIEHAKEMGTVLANKAQSKPYMFLKLQDTVVGPGDNVVKPPETEKLDWEVELAAVIGRQARRIGVDQALDCVAGYSVLNDISARDLNKRSDYPFQF